MASILADLAGLDRPGAKPARGAAVAMVEA
jgi:hypothetical protein